MLRLARRHCNCYKADSILIVLHLSRLLAAGGLNVQMLKKAVEMVNGKIETEASGNVTLSTVKTIAETGVTFISCGALTHSVVAMDISLKIKLLYPSGQT